jgi:hypothetical protein
VVAAERKLKSLNKATLIAELQPDWLVLRFPEVEQIEKADPTLLTKSYSTAKVFDVSARLASYPWLPGRGYSAYDAQFTVFKRNQFAGADPGRRQE